jgi:asparagine synthase (glutamine-hydrolysing)
MERMKARMAHRGPDADGTWLSDDGEVCLGHQRLSILDLSEAGAQPMTSRSGRSVIVYNGEIYNYRELRDRLLREKKVPAFRSTSDTEVLLEGIEAYGTEETLRQCKGMFAFAVFDRESGTLTLARDRIGEKPLYCGFVGSAFVFASDVGSIAALDGFRGEVDRGVLDIYFTHGYIPAPYSIYRGIRKLRPGTILRLARPYTEQTLTESVYWSVTESALKGRQNSFKGTRTEASEELERLLREAIRGQMIADVPVGAFLSAGIDSSTVVSLMQAESAGRVRTFTIGMEDAKYNEADAARAIAAHLGTDHTELTISDRDARAVIPLLPHMFSEPFADSSQIPTYLVSRMTRRYVTVSLSGDAGDELFCGYRSYASVERIWGKLSRVPYGLRSPAGHLLGRTPASAEDVKAIKARLLTASCPEEVYRQSYETDPLTERIAADHPGYPYAYTETGRDVLGEPNRDAMLMDMRMYHPDDILVKVDRTAMAVSLESRIPMLDRDVVEFAWTLPVDYLRGTDGAGVRTGKLVLRDVLYRHVPKELMDRPKKGFSVPVSRWLKEPELRPWAEGLLDPSALARQDLLDPVTVRRIWEDYTERGIWRVQIWYILMFLQWMESEAVLGNV